MNEAVRTIRILTKAAPAGAAAISRLASKEVSK